MASSKCEMSRCGLCHFYTHEGRRGGTCSQLNVPVASQWKACSLGISRFQDESEKRVGITEWSPANLTPEPTVLPRKEKVIVAA